MHPEEQRLRRALISGEISEGYFKEKLQALKSRLTKPLENAREKYILKPVREQAREAARQGARQAAMPILGLALMVLLVAVVGTKRRR